MPSEPKLSGLAAVEGDPHPWRAAIGLGSLSVVAGMVYSIWLAPAAAHTSCWWLNREAWFPLQTARYVANGAYPFLYEAQRDWVAGPLLPVLLAPVSAIGDHFLLLGSAEYPTCHPTLWLFFGPVGLATTIPFLHASRALAWEVRPPEGGRSPKVVWVQVAMTLAIVPNVIIVWSHFEDPLALACLLLSIREGLRRRWARSAVYMGLGIGFKQWCVLGLILLLVLVDREQRRRWLTIALGIPLFLYGIPLAADPRSAIPALFGAKAWLVKGHAALWEDVGKRVVAGTPFRGLIILVVVALTWRFSRDPSWQGLLAALGLSFIANVFLEPTTFAYYVCPAFAFLILVAYTQGTRIAYPTMLAIAAGVWFLLHPDPVLWWMVLASLLVLASVPSVNGLRRGEGHQTVATSSGAAIGARGGSA